MTEKRRLDVRMAESGLVPTRSKAQGLILAGKVRVNGQTVTKAGTLIEVDDRIGIDAGANPYVSRGGMKLAAALRAFAIRPQGWEVADVGASTGGFTDCWLQHGAALVYAVDVGYGQLDWRLRGDERVRVMERTNGRHLGLAQLGRSQPLDGASVDASFIGVRLLLEPLCTMVKEGGVIVALVKPQFEAGPRNLGKGGVVRDPAVHKAVLEAFWSDMQTLGLGVLGLIPSPIRGPSGNIEFLAALSPGNPGLRETDLDRLVAAAWEDPGGPS